jgi:hypothetical protein
MEDTFSLAVELSLDKGNDIMTFVQKLEKDGPFANMLGACSRMCKYIKDNYRIDVMIPVPVHIGDDAVLLSGPIRKSLSNKGSDNMIYDRNNHHHPTHLQVIEGLFDHNTTHQIKYFDKFQAVVSDYGKSVEFILWECELLSLEYRSGKFNIESLLDKIISPFVETDIEIDIKNMN